jgi:hypothetical protein
LEYQIILNFEGFMDFLSFFFSSFISKVPVIGVFILGLIGISFIAWFISLKQKKLTIFSQYAPTILTTAGLLGTFVGLTMGLQGIQFNDGNIDVQSFAGLMEKLKAVFVYALSGVASSLLFMLLNTFVLKAQNQKHLLERQDLQAKAKRHNQDLLEIQRGQENALLQLNSLQKKQLENQQLMQQDIAKLQFDNDNTQLAQLISQGVVQGLTPLLFEIKTAVADQGTEAIKKVLEDLKTEILLPMNGALNQTNIALENTTQAVKDTVKAIEASQQHNEKLITVVGEAAANMQAASREMHSLVTKIGETVQHMDDIQNEQKQSLDAFNKELKTNLSSIEPAIQNGLNHAKEALETAIGGASVLMSISINSASEKMQENIQFASNEMVTNIRSVLNDAGTELKGAVSQATTELNTSVKAIIQEQNKSIQDVFTKFDYTQTKFNEILTTFSVDMNGHLDRMATELAAVGHNAENMINSASENLKNTLGDIDQKLLNTSSELEKSLEKFRIQYQESLTIYLNQQTENLNGFLDRQNEQLEQTIGEQREGLVEVTNSLTEQFKFMDEKQRIVNEETKGLISRIDGVQSTILPKIQSIAQELSVGEAKLSQKLDQSAKHLTDVTDALGQLGQDLPEEFANAFKQLDSQYQRAFTDLDHGLKDAVNRLGSTVAALAAAIPLHDAMTQ